MSVKTLSRKPVIVIPAYRPDKHLVELVKALNDKELLIVVIDDGSGPEYGEIFSRLKFLYDCYIGIHDENRGKGAALKTGIRHAKCLCPGTTGIVTADADGQHAPEDILRAAEALEMSPEALVLGTRDFSGRDVTFKSRWGNRITSAVFGLVTGTSCRDTQTGLRGIPISFAEECLQIPGERFEYEFNVLLRAAKDRIAIREMPIRTIYLDENRSSHFRAVRDSVRIYANFLKFGASSLCSALVDLSLFTAFTGLLFGGASRGILYSTVLARLLSGAVNFSLNKRWVFRDRRRYGADIFSYLVLFFGQMLASWLLVAALSNLLPQLTAAKAIVDTGLFFLSYFVQKNIIFRSKTELSRKGGVC